MALFTKQLDTITYEEIAGFVSTWPEGVRVEYKEIFPYDKLSKTISSFANTLGGIVVLGVKEDKQAQTRAVIGVNKVTGIKESIIDCSVSGIYPSLIPDVKIVELPSDNNKVVIVIKVSESDLVPHAIQNSTRIYVRQENITQVIKDADTDQIEHMLKRRRNSEVFRDELMNKMFNHCKIDLEQVSQKKMPLIQVSITPLYPYKPIISKDHLFKFANEYETSRHGLFFRLRSESALRISDGVFNRIISDHVYIYNRLNDYGCLLSIQEIDEHCEKEGETAYLKPNGILIPIWDCLVLANQLYEKCTPPYRGNMLIKITLHNVLNRELIIDTGWSSDKYPSHEKYITLSRQFLTDELSNIHLMVQSISKEIFWAFQIKPSTTNGLVDRILKANGYIK